MSLLQREFLKVFNEDYDYLINYIKIRYKEREKEKYLVKKSFYIFG